MTKTFLAGILILAATLAAGCSDKQFSASASVGPNGSARVERGKYLVAVMGCNDCHTPLKMGAAGPEPDMARFLTGHPETIGPLPTVRQQGPWVWMGAATNTAFSGPWGVSYAANLTPDRNTGLGIWTEDMFVKAIRTGKHMGTSREILPPMPWPAFRNASDEDLKSVYAYLRTLKPVVNHVPDVTPPAVATDQH
ncbi:MAG: putative lipoprotein [Acidobacteria bacterium]|nr:putative lipoprotein [Acidobacteriota bacterium]